MAKRWPVLKKFSIHEKGFYPGDYVSEDELALIPGDGARKLTNANLIGPVEFDSEAR